MKVSWDDYSQYMEKIKNDLNHQSVSANFPRGKWGNQQMRQLLMIFGPYKGLAIMHEKLETTKWCPMET